MFQGQQIKLRVASIVVIFTFCNKLRSSTLHSFQRHDISGSEG